MSTEKTPPIPFIPTNRLETLADGIFAIAMTLLVLGIEVPAVPGNITSSIIMEYILYSLIPQIAIYILSFVLLASFWITHHIFFIIKRTDTKLLWINIFWLMSIAIVPFSTTMVGKFGGFQLSQFIFDINMLIIGILFYINWTYAASKGMIIEQMMPYADKIKKSYLFLPLLAILAMIISFIIPYGSIFIFILIPLTLSYIHSKKSKD